MSHDIAQIINTWMESQDRWVSSLEICSRFHVSERALRAKGRIPGILSQTCISSDAGFKHLRHSTVRERIACKHRITRHFIAEARRLRWLALGLTRIKTNNPRPMELKTGQLVLLQ